MPRRWPRIGFYVIEAAHAHEALATLASRAASIHIMFTDIMPGTIDGLALAHHTRRNWPWIALLVTSAIPPEDTALPAGSRFLRKPHTPSHVLAHLRDLLAA